MLLLTPRDSQVFVRSSAGAVQGWMCQVQRDHPRDVKIEQTAGQLIVNSRVALEQSHFGIDPFSILGGALQVQDRVDVRFMIRARRVPS